MIDPMADNPGLVPLKLGTAHNIVTYWELIQIYDLTRLLEEFTSLCETYTHTHEILKPGLTKSTYTAEMNNYQKIIEGQQKSLETKFSQLTQKMPRHKRGPFNVLGNLIKAITGNLDQDDARRYDQTITGILNAEKKLKTIVDKQITLTTNAIERFNVSISELATNQALIRSQVNSLTSLIKTMKQLQLSLDQRLTFMNMYLQIIITLNQINDILNVLECRNVRETKDLPSVNNGSDGPCPRNTKHRP